MIIQTRGATLWGLVGVPVSVEIDAGRGLPSFHIVGQADRIIYESRDRIRAAFRRCGIEFPSGRVSVNLAPGELPKSGSALDLAIAVGIAAAQGSVPPEAARQPLLIGELGFDGALRPVRGTLALVSGAAGSADATEVVVPAASGLEAALCPGIDVHVAVDLGGVLSHLRGEQRLTRQLPAAPASVGPPAIDLRDILGQETAKRALEIAAAGRHHLILMGPPGSGKTLLASRLPDLLPDLEPDAALEVARIQSVASAEPCRTIVCRPPLRAPHHSVSEAGFAGGGRPLRPGELSLAHRGVLFLDELPEFRRGVLESLRQPLEAGCIHIARAQGAHSLPAAIQLVAAMNPCPCGFAGDPTRECRCDPASVRRYQAKLSGPLLDRLDLHVSVPMVPRRDRRGASGPTTLEAQQRVAKVHAGAQCPWTLGDARSSARVQRERALWQSLQAADRSWLELALERLGLSLRAAGRVVSVGRTIAALDGRTIPSREDLAEALSYRWLDRA